MLLCVVHPQASKLSCIVPKPPLACIKLGCISVHWHVRHTQPLDGVLCTYSNYKAAGCTIPPLFILSWACDLTAALAYVHNQGFVHLE